MSTETTQHTFSAPVKSLGQQQRGAGWDMVLGWRLPGSKYDLHLYGQEWDDVSNFNVGYAATWTIQRGSLKDSKDGKYASDYFWDWDQDAAELVLDVDELFAGKPESGREPPERPNTGIQVEGVVQGHLEKLAVDLYISEGPDSRPLNGGIDYLRIREIRDSFYHQIKEKPIQPVGYCYEHETLRRATKAGSYVHEIGDQWCAEGGIYDAQGQPVTEATTNPVDDLPF